MLSNACTFVLVAAASILPQTSTVDLGEWIPGPHQNSTTDKLPSVLGSDLEPCDLSAVDGKMGGYCSFLNEGGSARSLCIQPPQLMGKPFCIEVPKYGMYLQAQPSTVSDTNLMRPKCASTPEAAIFSAYADAHFLSPAFHAVAAQAIDFHKPPLFFCEDSLALGRDPHLQLFHYRLITVLITHARKGNALALRKPSGFDVLSRQEHLARLTSDSPRQQLKGYAHRLPN